MKRMLSILLAAVMLMSLAAAAAVADAYPDGTVSMWSTGQPQFRMQYFETWLENHRDIAPNVQVESTTISTTNDGQQKIAMFNMSEDWESMPNVIYLDAVGVMNMVANDLLVEVTDFYAGVADQLVAGAASDVTIDGHVYALPDSVRPQVLFYNAAIFEKYDIDPAMMSTMNGYLEAGRLLKERSNGEVYLSYIDPSTFTWRYWGRRGLMPQANARIWDDEGNVIIGSDEGTKLALGFLDQLNSEGLLYKTNMMSQPLYEATDDGIIATYYIGAFWDEFLRGNLTKTAGDWRVMSAPVFEEIGTAGAPVGSFYCLVDAHNEAYTELAEMMWKDFVTDGEAYKTWVNKMTEVNGPYSNPISLEMLQDPFWQEGSDFYGGQSFRKAESDGLINPSANMPLTLNDAEADSIISAEIEKYVAGEQTMDQAIANMQSELTLRIGVATYPGK